MGISERRSREKESLRRSILAAAADLFLVNGVDAVSMRMIAEKIEYSPTTLYLYFKDKAELVRSVVNQFFADFIQEIEALRRSSPDDALGTLRKALRAYVDFGVSHPVAYRLAFMVGPPQDPQVPPEEDVGLLAYRQLAEMVGRCLAEGVFRPADPAVVTNVIWSMNHGIASLLITMPILPGSDKETVVEASIQAAVDAFR